MSTKAALERQLRSLEAEMGRLQLDHAKELNAKNGTLRDTGLARIDLYQTYPNLRRLTDLLGRAHDAASPLRSGNSDHRPEKGAPPDPTGNLATSIRIDDERTTDIDLKLERLAEWIEDNMGDRGPIDEPRPQCWNPQCLMWGLFQAFTADVCIECEHGFGEFRYKPKYLRERKRCWTRDCPERGKVRACEHSI